jgi:predicted RNA polymerase sigma factor
VVALNRAIARSRVVGAREGIAEVLAIEGRERLDAYPFYWATLGDLAIRDGDRLQAHKWLSLGLSSARTEREREVFLRRLSDCADPMS